MDVSQDGHWVLATCATLLLVIPTALSSEKTGFESRMGKNKPAPLRLTLHPSDIAKYNLKNYSFTPATFNNGDRLNSENSIVSSLGAYIVTWNFMKVKKGVLDKYVIKSMAQDIVANQFRFNREQNVIVTLPKNLTIRTRHK